MLVKQVEEQKKKIEEADKKMRHVQQKKKENQMRRKMEENVIEVQKKSMEKLEEIRKKEENIRMNLYIRSKKKIMLNQSKSLQVAERLRKTVEFNETQILNLRKNFEEKQNLMEKIKIKFELSKKEKSDLIKIKASLKEKEIREVIVKLINNFILQEKK